MARIMFNENRDTKIYRVVVEAVVSEGHGDWWSKVYGPYPLKGTRDAQLTRVRKELDRIINKPFKGQRTGLLDYEIWPEEGTISWSRED